MYTVHYKDCVLSAAQNLQLDDVSNALKTAGANYSGDAAEEINLLLRCVNSVLHEIACDYIPLKKTEKLKSADFRIYYRDFSENIIDIYSVKYNGSSVAFKRFHDCILVPLEAGFAIEYSYAPLKGTLETKLPWEDARLGERIIGYGAACEYSLLTGNTDEAAMWDKRFKDALFKASVPKSEMKIKARKWA